MGAVLSFVWAALCNATLNLLQTGGDASRLVTYDLMQTPNVFLLSSALLWVVLMLLFAVLGRLFLSGGLLLAACVVVGFANYEKLHVRNEPLMPSDLTFAGNTGFLMDMISARALVAVVSVVTLVLLIAVLLGRIAARSYPRLSRRTHGRLWWGGLAGRVALALVALLMLSYVAHFNDDDNRVRGAYENAGARWAFWYQKVNYLRHGAVAGFLYNLPTVPMEVPEGYSQQRMDELADKYEAEAREMNQTIESPGEVDDVNIVLVLSESFADPTEIPGVELERDPIPFTRRLMATNPSGSLLTQHFGGGTANMEFEALTGLSISQFTPQHDTPYSMSVYQASDYPSVVGYLKASGHQATGIHPYMPTMYKRESAYTAMGFDRFISEDAMKEKRLIDNSKFIADSSAFDETLLQMRESDGPDFVNLVTMQNHYPTDDVYDDPMQARGVATEAAAPLGNFARGLEHSDRAFEDFISELESWDEPTAVVFYGDHQPALWEADPEISSDDEAMHRAPFVLWSNTQDLPARRIPLVSPTQFMPLLFQELGLELPPFYALLSQLNEHASAMENGRYYSPSGREIDNPQDDPELTQLLQEYRLVQYDLAVGQRYSVDRMFPQ